MKKTLLLLSAIVIAGCSSDASDSSVIADPGEETIIPTLQGAVITPTTSSLTGYGENIEYVITKNGVALENWDYQWAVSDTLHGFVNGGFFQSRLIGQTAVTVTDNAGNTLNAAVQTNAKITDMPDMPYFKIGATREEIIAGMESSGWTKFFDQWPWVEIKYKKGTKVVHYSFGGAAGLFRADYINDYYDITASGGVSDVNYLLDYNNERFLRLSVTDSHYYGYMRWYYINQFEQKVYVEIKSDQSNSPKYTLRFSGS